LLKFTHREAFKTWELSLAGFLVAADILENRSNEQNLWYLRTPAKDRHLDLVPEIWNACNGIKNFDDFITRLASICSSDAEIFKTFRPVLEKAFQLLQRYWEILRDHTKSHADRRRACLEQIEHLEREALSDEFYQELSRCIQINDLLRRTLQTKRPDYDT
jgi:hypothetical protein